MHPADPHHSADLPDDATALAGAPASRSRWSPPEPDAVRPAAGSLWGAGVRERAGDPSTWSWRDGQPFDQQPSDASAPATAWSRGPSSATPSASAGTPPQRAPRRRRIGGGVFATALLSAVLASGSTFAIVSVVHPGSTGSSGAAIPTPNANVTTTGGTTTVQQEDITGVVARTKDSVVTLTSEIATTRGGPFGDGTATGVGTGIILTADGYVLTNRHVAEGSQSMTATLADGSTYPATVVTLSETQDLALVKIDATGLKPATIGDSGAITVGQTAIAIGSPLGTFTETVTKGSVSALDRTITVQDEQTGRPVTLSGLIQTDAAINPGNSGGPLLNSTGEVVGVNTATASTAEGIGFAIPIKEAASLIAQARAASVA
jgi:serine protease Do